MPPSLQAIYTPHLSPSTSPELPSSQCYWTWFNRSLASFLPCGLSQTTRNHSQTIVHHCWQSSCSQYSPFPSCPITFSCSRHNFFTRIHAPELPEALVKVQLVEGEVGMPRCILPSHKVWLGNPTVRNSLQRNPLSLFLPHPIFNRIKISIISFYRADQTAPFRTSEILETTVLLLVFVTSAKTRTIF